MFRTHIPPAMTESDSTAHNRIAKKSMLTTDLVINGWLMTDVIKSSNHSFAAHQIQPNTAKELTVGLQLQNHRQSTDG